MSQPRGGPPGPLPFVGGWEPVEVGGADVDVAGGTGQGSLAGACGTVRSAPGPASGTGTPPHTPPRCRYRPSSSSPCRCARCSTLSPTRPRTGTSRPSRSTKTTFTLRRDTRHRGSAPGSPVPLRTPHPQRSPLPVPPPGPPRYPHGGLRVLRRGPAAAAAAAEAPRRSPQQPPRHGPAAGRCYGRRHVGRHVTSAT